MSYCLGKSSEVDWSFLSLSVREGERDLPPPPGLLTLSKIECHAFSWVRWIVPIPFSGVIISMETQ